MVAPIRCSLIVLLVAASMLGAASALGQTTPSLTRIDVTAEGYALIGKGFGKDARALRVVENSAEVPANRIVSVADDRIVVSSRPSGVVRHQVIVSGRASATVSFTHASAKPADGVKRVAPMLSKVERTTEGYALIGTGFGSDHGAVQVFEGPTRILTARIAALTDTRITVASKPTGTVDHKVVVAGQSSSVIRHVHPAPAVAFAPKTATTGELSLTGLRFVPKEVTTGELSLTGER